MVASQPAPLALDAQAPLHAADDVVRQPIQQTRIQPGDGR
jgi:hypothetical protein